MNNFSADVREKMIRKNKININSLITIDFEKLAKTAIKIYIFNKTVREFSDNRIKQEKLSELIDSLRYALIISKSKNRFIFFIIIPRRILIKIINKLIKAFNALALIIKITLNIKPGISRVLFNSPGKRN